MKRLHLLCLIVLVALPAFADEGAGLVGKELDVAIPGNAGVMDSGRFFAQPDFKLILLKKENGKRLVILARTIGDSEKIVSVLDPHAEKADLIGASLPEGTDVGGLCDLSTGSAPAPEIVAVFRVVKGKEKPRAAWAIDFKRFVFTPVRKLADVTCSLAMDND